MLALLDTTLLSNFAHVQRPTLLQVALGINAATSPLVITELRAGETAGFVPVVDWSWLTVVSPTQPELNLAGQLENRLDSGEAECLAIAYTRQAKFLSDDLAARRLAQQYDVVVSGSLGVLLRLVEDNQVTVSQADHLLQSMMACGYRSPVASLQALLP